MTSSGVPRTARSLWGVRSRAWTRLALAAVGVAWVWAWLGLGGVRPDVMQGVHLVLALAALALAATSDRYRRQVRGGPILGIGALLVGAAALALVPLPQPLLGWLAPGAAAARPDATWWTSAVVPWAVLPRLADLLAGLVVALVAAAHPVDRSRPGWRVATVALVVLTALLVVGWGHVLAGARAVFDVVHPRDLAPGPFLAPLVNPSFTATLIVLLVPVAWVTAGRAEGPAGGAALALVVAGALTVVWIGSVGALVALAVVLVLVGGRGRWLGAGMLVVAVLVGVLTAGDGSASPSGRLEVWGATLGLALDHAFLGAGALDPAVSAYRGDTWFAGLAHAHSDPLEWVAATGAVGTVAGLAALVLGVRAARAGRRSTVGGALCVGLVGVGVHALVDFPLQVPAVWLAAAAAFGTVVGAGTGRGLGRAPLVVLAVAQLGAVAVREVDARVEAAVVAVRAAGADGQPAGEAAAVLARLAPGRGWHALHAAWAAQRAGDPDAAVALAGDAVAAAPHDGTVLREAAAVAVRAGAWASARTWLDRALVRAPWDHRNHVLAARLARVDGALADARAHWVAAFAREAPATLLDEAYATMPLAAPWLEVLAPLDPSWTAALGRVALRNGEPDAAVTALARAAERDPARYADFPPYARALLAAGRTDEAQIAARAALAAHAEDALAHLVASEVAEAAGDPSGALAALARAAELDPRHRPRHVRAVVAHDGVSAAVRLVAHWRLIDRVHPTVDIALAQAALAQGERGVCRDAVRSLVDDPIVGERARTLMARCAL